MIDKSRPPMSIAVTSSAFQRNNIFLILRKGIMCVVELLNSPKCKTFFKMNWETCMKLFHY